MFHKQNQEEEIAQTIQLTAKLQKHLRKLMSSRKYNFEQTQEKHHDHLLISELEKQIKQLRQEQREMVLDNEQVCRDVIRLRQQNRQLRKEVNQNKKYIKHLQNYNSELKKELLFWMRKPTKNQQYPQQQQSVGQLMNQVLKLRRQNQTRQGQLQSLQKSLSIKQIKIPPESIKKNSLRIQSLAKLKKQELQQKSNKIKKNIQHKHNKSLNECTSCHYQEYITHSRPKQNKLKKSYSTIQKNKLHKNLCQCHKTYIETSRFIP